MNNPNISELAHTLVAPGVVDRPVSDLSDPRQLAKACQESAQHLRQLSLVLSGGTPLGPSPNTPFVLNKAAALMVAASQAILLGPLPDQGEAGQPEQSPDRPGFLEPPKPAPARGREIPENLRHLVDNPLPGHPAPPPVAVQPGDQPNQQTPSSAQVVTKANKRN